MVAVFHGPLVLGALLLLLALQHGASAEEPGFANRTGVHVAFLTDCQMYSDWQSVGAAFSFKMSGQPGSVIRVMCCSEEQAKNYNKGLLGMVDTWVAPDATHSKRTGDRYVARVCRWCEGLPGGAGPPRHHCVAQRLLSN